MELKAIKDYSDWSSHLNNLRAYYNCYETSYETPVKYPCIVVPTMILQNNQFLLKFAFIYSDTIVQTLGQSGIFDLQMKGVIDGA